MPWASPRGGGAVAEGFDKEKVIAEARSRLSALYERYMNEIEAEADRILRERIAALEPLKEELLKSLRGIQA